MTRNSVLMSDFDSVLFQKAWSQLLAEHSLCLHAPQGLASA